MPLLIQSGLTKVTGQRVKLVCTEPLMAVHVFMAERLINIQYHVVSCAD